MKKVRFYLSVIIIFAILIFWGGKEERQEVDQKRTLKESLVIYTSRSDNLLNATIPLFEEKYGVEVELVKGELGELLSQIRDGEDSPTADIVMGGTYSHMYSNTDLFQEYVSVNDKYLIDNYKNTTGVTTNYILEGSCLIVNKSLVQGIDIDGYEDLLDYRLKGKIITANPIISSSAFSQLTNTLLAMGGYESEIAWDYVGKLMEQVGEITSSSEKVYTSVASGNYIVGLTYESPCVALVSDSTDVEIIYPKEGTVYLPAMVAISNKSNNPEYAKHFIDFITSKDMQNIYANILMKRSLYRDAIESEFLTPIKQIHVLEEDMEYVQSHKLEIISRYSVIVDKIMGEE